MTTYLQYPPYFTPTLTNSGIVNTSGYIVHEPLPLDFVPINRSVVEDYGSSAFGSQFDYTPFTTVYSSVYLKEPLSTTCTGTCLQTLGFTYITSVSYEEGEETALYQIYTYGSYTYAATNKGLDVYYKDTVSCSKLSSIKINTLYGNGTTLYIGTSEGLYEITLDETCSNTPVLSDITLESVDIKYIHGEGDKLIISTSLGIEYIDKSSNPTVHSKTTHTETGKCFLANQGYYTTTVSGKYSLNRIDIMLCDWAEATHSYTTGSGIFEDNLQLTDMYITKGTAQNGGNTIFCTTSSGVYVIDEDTSQYAIYYTR